MIKQRVFNELEKINYPYTDSLTRECIETMNRQLIFRENEYVGYDVTVTFIPHRKMPEGHKTETIQKQMKRLYLYGIVRAHLFEGDSRWAKNYHDYQPFSEFFMEEHAQKAVACPHYEGKIFKNFQFPERKHYHGILNVHPEMVERMDALLGENTLNDFGEGVMTSLIRRVRDIGWIGYMMKDHQKYSNTNLNFGPNLSKPRK
jgi:hypothetical protein